MTNGEVIDQALARRVLDLELGENDAGAGTVREYLTELLLGLWEQGSVFNSKRPFGFSFWRSDLYLPLIKAELVVGTLDENGYLDSLPDEEEIKAERLITAAIREMCRPQIQSEGPCAIRTPLPIIHNYLSTSCFHAQEPGREHLHADCAISGRRWNATGYKIGGRCKWCTAQCICPCHNRTNQEDQMESITPKIWELTGEQQARVSALESAGLVLSAALDQQVTLEIDDSAETLALLAHLWTLLASHGAKFILADEVAPAPGEAF